MQFSVTLIPTFCLFKTVQVFVLNEIMTSRCLWDGGGGSFSAFEFNDESVFLYHGIMIVLSICKC